MKERLAIAERKARSAQLIRFKRGKGSIDDLRPGRMGLDFHADETLLKLDTYNKLRLRKRLKELMSQHRWGEAAGVISVLLRAAAWRGRADPNDRVLFPAAMEIIRQQQGGDDKRNKIRKLFNLMYVHQPTNRSIESKRLKGEVQLELSLYLSSIEDYEGAYNTLRPVVGTPPLNDDAASNLAYGLILHRMWFDLASDELAEEESSNGSIIGEWKPPDLADGVEKSSARNVEAVRVFAYGNESADSSPSEEITTEKPVQSYMSRKRRRPAEVGDDYAFWSNAKVYIQPDMDRRLFPVRLPYEQPYVEYIVPLGNRSKELCSDAVRHLQQAVVAAPEMTQALVPLVQLLLALGDAEAANREIDICYQATKSFIPLSIRALLLESLSVRDIARLASCYEGILQLNPSSFDAINGLIRLHDEGVYETEALVYAIAGHLDAEPGSVHVWHKLSDCLLEVSTHTHGEVDNDTECEPSLDDFVYAFVDRGIWWTNKHFSGKHLEERVKDKVYWKLLAYKAACAFHIYGSNFEFAETVLTMLKGRKMKRLAAEVDKHLQLALCILGS